MLCALSESLQDVLNYGLFQPATSGRDANFLEEERLLREYPQSFEKGVPYLEVRPAGFPEGRGRVPPRLCPLPEGKPLVPRSLGRLRVRKSQRGLLSSNYCRPPSRSGLERAASLPQASPSVQSGKGRFPVAVDVLQRGAEPPTPSP